jgi:hypothetical protein
MGLVALSSKFRDASADPSRDAAARSTSAEKAASLCCFDLLQRQQDNEFASSRIFTARYQV